jgi:spore coat-associated protein N
MNAASVAKEAAHQEGTDPLSAHGASTAGRDEPRRERRRLLVGLLVVAVALAGLTTVVTGAFFTGTQSVTGNTFSTGTVDVGVSPAATALTFSAMAPGDTVTAPLTVSNTGTLAQRYAVLSTTDATDANFLAAQLQMTIKSGVTTCTTAGFTATGTVLYGPGVLGSTTGTKVIGDAAQGAQTGDRTLAAGSSEVLCAQVTLPTSTGNAYQNATTTATLRFDAEQTTNNP